MASDIPNFYDKPQYLPEANSYSTAGQTMSGAGDVMGAAAAVPSPATPFLAGASLAMKGAGTVADIYGKYQDRKEAKERYEKQLAMWEEAERERKTRQAMEDQRRSREEAYFAADYSQGFLDKMATNPYGGYGG
ncbi:MAG: hypothetical protein GY861_11270 [bacterium]|nr:hypothetical protein [bacterium]